MRKRLRYLMPSLPQSLTVREIVPRHPAPGAERQAWGAEGNPQNPSGNGQ